MNEIGLSINTRRDSSDEELISIAKHADQVGYHSFWAAESWGRDAFTVLTVVACNTQNIRLATGIVNVFSRTPRSSPRPSLPWTSCPTAALSWGWVAAGKPW